MLFRSNKKPKPTHQAGKQKSPFGSPTNWLSDTLLLSGAACWFVEPADNLCFRERKRKKTQHIHLSFRANNTGPLFKMVLNICLAISTAQSLTFLIQIGRGICTEPIAKEGLSGAATFPGSKGSNLWIQMCFGARGPCWLLTRQAGGAEGELTLEAVGQAVYSHHLWGCVQQGAGIPN